MSNITVTHSASGLVQAEVVRAERITPHMMRVTFGGDDLARFEFRGFDQWFRLALPVRGEEALARLPHRFGMGGTLKWLAMGKEHRPVIRNYTVRDFRPEVRELDVDFVVHGDDGIAGPWAQRAEPGERIAAVPARARAAGRRAVRVRGRRAGARQRRAAPSREGPRHRSAPGDVLGVLEAGVGDDRLIVAETRPRCGPGLDDRRLSPIVV